MRFIALDLDKKTALATIFKSQAQFDQKRVGLEQTSLTSFSTTLRKEDVLCLEACPGSYHVAEFLQPAVAKVVLVNPKKFGSIIDANKQKTDRNDSGLMCRLFMADALPTVWMPDKETREERMYAEHCRSLDQESTRMRNKVHALLTEYGFGPQADQLLKKDISLLMAVVNGSLPEMARDALASTLRLLQVVNHELQAAKAKIVIKASARESVELAASMPGIDDYLGFIITSGVGDIARFKTASSLSNYAGVTPTLRSSGPGRPKHGHITKRGSKSLRWAAIEAAKNAVKTRGRFRDRYAKLCKKGKGRSKALVAIANDLLKILWHVLSKGEKYRDVTAAFQQRKDKRREKQRKAAAKAVRSSADSRQIILEGIGAVRNTLQSMAA